MLHAGVILKNKKKQKIFGDSLTKVVLTRRSIKTVHQVNALVKKKLVKMTRFCIFQRIFKNFSEFKKSETSNLLQVNFLEYLNHHTDHICS